MAIFRMHPKHVKRWIPYDLGNGQWAVLDRRTGELTKCPKRGTEIYPSKQWACNRCTQLNMTRR